MLSLAFISPFAHAADNEDAVIARFHQTLVKLQDARIITTQDADYLRKNATREKTAKCDSKVVSSALIAIAQHNGAKAKTVEEALDYFAENKMLNTPDYYRREIPKGSISGTATRNLLLRLAKYVQ